MDVTAPSAFLLRTPNSPDRKVFVHRSKIDPSKAVSFTAERGLIHIHDEATGGYKCCRLSSFIHRAGAIQDAARLHPDSAVRLDASRLVSCMLEVIAVARAQGDPFEVIATGRVGPPSPLLLPPMPGRHLPIESLRRACYDPDWRR